jgi:hypothetical protein
MPETQHAGIATNLARPCPQPGDAPRTQRPYWPGRNGTIPIDRGFAATRGKDQWARGFVPCRVWKDRDKQEHGNVIGVPGTVDGPTAGAVECRRSAATASAPVDGGVFILAPGPPSSFACTKSSGRSVSGGGLGSPAPCRGRLRTMSEPVQESEPGQVAPTQPSAPRPWSTSISKHRRSPSTRPKGRALLPGPSGSSSPGGG